MRRRQPALAGSLALLLFACGGSESPTEAHDAAAPVFNFTNGPASPGPVVLRLQESDWFIFLFPDARANLTASVGIVEPFSAICESGPVTIPPEDLQFLFSPTGRLAVLVKGRDMPVVIYAGAMTNFCTDLTSVPVIGTGTAKFVFNLADFNSESSSNGYRAQGTVDLTAGGQAHFSGVVKFVTTPDGNTRFLVSQVTLSPIRR